MQNIYDNEDFFNGYKQLRESDINLNVLLEQPAMAKLLPDLEGKRVLDLGCGYGVNCRDFIDRGAERAVGVDLSEKMLEVAKESAFHEKIEYRNMSMTDIAQIDEKFDLVYSSLAFHYIEDFAALAKAVYEKLNNDGTLIFSQEHPIITATVDGKGHWNRDENGNKVSYTFSNYGESGKRVHHWFVDGVVIYHRPMGEIVTALAKAGFVIDEMCEPIPENWAIEKRPDIKKEYLKPNFLIIKARKEVR